MDILLAMKRNQETGGKLYEIAYAYLGNTGMMDFGVDVGC